MGLIYEQMPNHSQTNTDYFIRTMIVWADVDWVQTLLLEADRQLLKMQEYFSDQTIWVGKGTNPYHEQS